MFFFFLSTLNVMNRSQSKLLDSTIVNMKHRARLAEAPRIELEKKNNHLYPRSLTRRTNLKFLERKKREREKEKEISNCKRIKLRFAQYRDSFRAFYRYKTISGGGEVISRAPAPLPQDRVPEVIATAPFRTYPAGDNPRLKEKSHGDREKSHCCFFSRAALLRSDFLAVERIAPLAVNCPRSRNDALALCSTLCFRRAN